MATLAYGFWHWKQDGVARERYEIRQKVFQGMLSSYPPRGFLRATVGRISGAPWAAAGGPAYEDWYLVEDMAALERLNDAAVSGQRQDPHDTVAALAAGGIAGLYGLRAGAPLSLPGFSYWFAKPSGMSYQALFEGLAPLLPDWEAALWSRRMTLGPTPEFCLQSRTPLELPAAFEAQRFELEPVWPGAMPLP